MAICRINCVCFALTLLALVGHCLEVVPRLRGEGFDRAYACGHAAFGQSGELFRKGPLKGPKELIDIDMCKPLEPVRFAFVGVACVCALSRLMFCRAVLAAPVLSMSA